MSRKRTFLIGVVLWAPLLLSASALAHGIWLDGNKRHFNVLYGEGNQTESYSPSNVKSVKAIDKYGNEILTRVRTRKDGVKISTDKRPALVTVNFDNGYWVKVGGKWINKSKREMANYTTAEHSIKFTKALFDWSFETSKAVGLALEILPLENPFTIIIGGMLPLKIIYNGQPKCGVEVEFNFNENELHKTNKHGIVLMPVTRRGWQYVEASINNPIRNDPYIDRLYYTSTLTFEIKR